MEFTLGMENVPMAISERLHILLSAGLVFLLFLWMALRNGYFTFSREDKRIPQKLSTKAFLGAFTVFLFFQIILAPLTFQLGHYFYALGSNEKTRGLSSEWQAWFTIYAIILTGLGLFFYYRLLSKSNREIIAGPYAFYGWTAKLHDMLIACMSWILSYPLVVVISQLVAMLVAYFYQNVEPQQVAVQLIKDATVSKPLFICMALLVIFIVPLIEELLFRGFLQNWLKRFFHPMAAIVLTSGIFAVFHFSPQQGMGNIELLTALFVLSCFLGFIYERQKSIWAPISLHAIFNAVSILLILLVEKPS